MSNPKKTASNPFFKSKYSDLNAVREAVIPILNANGIAVLQPTVSENGKNYVKTVLLHESGQSIESFTEVVVGKINDPQAVGSGISYARRYGLQSLVCVGADDDDGNKAAEQAKPEVKASKPIFTVANFHKAKKAGATVEQIKAHYLIDFDTEQDYINYLAQ